LTSKKCQTKALGAMKRTVEFRREMDVDRLRLMDFRNYAAAADADGDGGRLKERIASNCRRRAAYVRSFDKDGRATYVFEPRFVDTDDHADPNLVLKQHLYALERAVACTRSSDGTVNAVVNFRDFSATKHAPPIEIGKQFLSALRNHYVGRVHRIFVVDAPAAFYCLWALLKPFVGTSTKQKLQFVNSRRQKLGAVGALYEPEQVPDWLLPGGRKSELGPCCGDSVGDDDAFLMAPFDTTPL